MATTKTAEEIEHLAYQDFTFDGKTLPPGQTTPHGYRKFFRAYKKGYDRASLQTSELIEAVEKVRDELHQRSINCFKDNNDYQSGKETAYTASFELLDELLKTHKPTPLLTQSAQDYNI